MTPPEPGSVADLLDRLAEAIEATPAVVGLEPTLSNAIRRLGGEALPSAISGHRTVRRAAADGISLRQIAEQTDVRVDLITSTERPARVTAEEVEQRVRSVLAEAGHTVGSVVITVLSTRRS